MASILVTAMIAVAQALLAMDLETGKANLPRSLSSEKQVTLPLHNAGEFYYTTLEIGTPAQKLQVIVDTGSSDLWVPEPGAISQSASAANSGYHDQQTTFNLNMSSTFQYNDSDFSIGYMDGTTATGYWGTDVFGLGDIFVENASLAVGTFSNVTMGILGLGMMAFESTISGTLDGELQGSYLNIPALLKDQGIINTISYSLALGSCDDSDGSLVFGGIDHASYAAPLLKVPFVRTSDGENPVTTSIMMHGISVQNKTLLECSIPVLIDSGTSVNYLPGPFVEAIGARFNASWNDDSGVYIIDCNTDTSLELDFSGIKVEIPGTQNIPLLNQTGDQLYNNEGDALCMLPFYASSTSYILGVSTLRSLYLSFDFENKELAIAQYKPTKNTEVEEITDTIPGAQEGPSYSSTYSTTSYSLALSVSHVSGIKNALSLTSIMPDSKFKTQALTSGSDTSSTLAFTIIGTSSSTNGAALPQISYFTGFILSYLL